MLLFPYRVLFKKLVVKASDAIYYFRVKNCSDYQNGWVAVASYQLLFKKVVLVSLCVSAY